MRKKVVKVLICLSLLLIYINIASALKNDRWMANGVKVTSLASLEGTSRGVRMPDELVETENGVIEIEDEQLPGGAINHSWQGEKAYNILKNYLKMIVEMGMAVACIVVLREYKKK